MKVLFVRPPRYMWPFNSESSSFWQPLGFASMAAVLLEDDHNVKIIDCLPLKIGWKTLEKILEKEMPDILCIGDETSSSPESLKLAALMKKISPGTVVIAGGYHFSHMVEESLGSCIDIVVRGEGEITLKELCRALEKQSEGLSKIKGISFKRNDSVYSTEDRPLIADLDSLPIPAYSLLPMWEYGRRGKNHPRLAAIEHGRGCTNNCTFCSISNHWSRSYRTKSVERVMEEIDILHSRYGRKTLGWVDGTWNADSGWTREWSESMKGYDMWSTVWARADKVVEDHKRGILRRQVEAGVVQYMIGIESLDDVDLARLNKNQTASQTLQAFRILSRFPQVYTIGSFIYGFPQDSKEILKRFFQLINLKSRHIDSLFPLPFTPFPAAKEWNIYKKRFNRPDFRKFNLHKPILPTRYLTKKELNDFFIKFILLETFHPRVLFRDLKSLRRPRRVVNVKLSLKRSVLRSIRYFISSRFDEDYSFDYGKKPDWYDS